MGAHPTTDLDRESHPHAQAAVAAAGALEAQSDAQRAEALKSGSSALAVLDVGLISSGRSPCALATCRNRKLRPNVSHFTKCCHEKDAPM